jgi:methylamine dehydrogenase accessory protein MauD
MSNQSRLPTVLLLMLMGINALLMIAIIGLFVRMNQLQEQVLVQQGVLMAMGSSLQGGPLAGGTGLEVGTKAPSFSLPDANGVMVSLDDYEGQPVLLVFSSTHCTACRDMYEDVRRFSQRWEDGQIVMLSVGTAEENQEVLESEAFAFPLIPVAGWDEEAITAYQVRATPSFFVIDGEGVIANTGFASSVEQMEALVQGAEGGL